MSNRTIATTGLLSVYWLAFVWLGIVWAHNPGFVVHRETVPYPVRDVILASTFVLVLVGALGLFLLWPRSWNRWARIAYRAAYVLFLILLLMTGMVTDSPGIEYVPPAFGLATLLLLGALGLWRVATRRSSSRSVV